MRLSLWVCDMPSKLTKMLPTVFRYIAYDSFNRVDGAVGNAETGQAWSAYRGSGLIVSNRLGGVTETENILGLNVGRNNYSAQLQLSVTSNYSGMAFRISGANDYWLFYRYTNGWRLSKRVNGAALVVVDSGLPAPNSGDIFLVVLNGSSIKGYINGNLVTDVVDSFNSSATIVGAEVYGATPARVDNFAVEAL